MNKLKQLLILTLIFTVSTVGAAKPTLIKKDSIEKYEMEIGGRKFIAIPMDEIKFDGFKYIVDPVISQFKSTTTAGTYACYKCCTGQKIKNNFDNEKFCNAAFNGNWKRGKDCGCEESD